MNDGIDFGKARRENMRWLILSVLDRARPIGASETLILSTVQALLPDATQLELRREMDYLEGRKLLEISNKGLGLWHAGLTRTGVDVVEYTVRCEAGIARPPKYF